MTDVLGYKRFGAQGGDWGGFVTSRLGLMYAERLAGIHLNLLADPPRSSDARPTPRPRRRYSSTELQHFLKEETGYQWIQGTKPQTLGLWADRFAGRSGGLDRGEVPHLERLRAAIPSRCFTKRRAADQHHAVLGDRRNRLVVLAILCSDARALADPGGKQDRRCLPATPQFPAEILRPPRSVAEKVYNIQRWTKMEQGGHFAALEQPEALVREVRSSSGRCGADSRRGSRFKCIPSSIDGQTHNGDTLRCTRGKSTAGLPVAP